MAERPLSSGTCLQRNSTSAVREMASPELLLPQVAAACSRVCCSERHEQSREERGIWRFWRVVASLQARCIPRERHSSPRRGGREESVQEGLPGAPRAHRAVWVSEWNMLPNIS